MINVSQGIYVFIIFVIKRSVITAIGKKKEIITQRYSKWTFKEERATSTIETKKRRGMLDTYISMNLFLLNFRPK